MQFAQEIIGIFGIDTMEVIRVGGPHHVSHEIIVRYKVCAGHGAALFERSEFAARPKRTL